VNAVDLILDRLASVPGGSPRILGIDGPAGSGKSTLAAAVSAATGAPVVGIDDFVGWTDLDPAGATWWPRLEAEVIAPFVAGEALSYHRRDWYGDAEGIGVLDDPIVVGAPGPLLVLEGVSVTRRAIADRLALRVWVEASRDVCLERGLARDGEEMRDHWLVWQELESAFFAVDGARERADLVLPTA